MGRVPWERHAGDVEPVIGILLCRLHPSAQRVRPSRGDGGIDVFVPTEAGLEVYQVKGFARNLEFSQKRQIQDSYERLLQSSSQRGFAVTGWHLTMPLNPTNENLEWLDELTEGASFPCDWRGLDFIDGLAAEFPNVIDYYLRDGKERLERSIEALTRILQGRDGRGGPLAPDDVTADLRSIYKALNEHDPHFRYSIRVDEHTPNLLKEPGMIFARQETRDSICVSTLIFARYDAAVEDRPIPFKTVIRAPQGSELEKQIKDFVLYGTGVDAPAGSVTVDSTGVPGGLGGLNENSRLVLIPRPAEGQEGYSIRIQVVDPAGTELALATLEMEPPTYGHDLRGARVAGIDSGGVFQLDVRVNLHDQRMFLTLEGHDYSGRPPEDVIPGLRILQSFTPPNGFRFAPLRGPFLGDPEQIPNGFGQPFEDVELMLDLAQALVVLQEHTTEQLRMPTEVSGPEYLAICEAASLLRDEILEGTWTRMTILDSSDNIDKLRKLDEFSFGGDTPLEVQLDGSKLSFGKQRWIYESARIDQDQLGGLAEGQVQVAVVPGKLGRVTRQLVVDSSN